MDEEERYTRITLRIPKELHERLSDAADTASRSTNAEIVGRLAASFIPGVEQLTELRALADSLKEEVKAAVGEAIDERMGRTAPRPQTQLELDADPEEMLVQPVGGFEVPVTIRGKAAVVTRTGDGQVVTRPAKTRQEAAEIKQAVKRASAKKGAR